MLAEQFGYRVMPGVALDTPGVQEILRGRERPLRLGAALLAVEAVLLTAAVVSWEPGSAVAVILVIVLLLTAAPLLLWRRARRLERAVMATYGWQVWPCASESVKVVAAEGQRHRGRRWARQDRVVLLRPDGQAQCAFLPPDEGRRPDGEVWFAGDTRFGGMLAMPGGLPFRYVVRAKPGGARGTPEEDRAARAAGLMPRSWRPRG
ncbi:hypothetical protein ACLQ2R_30695 [Streptosporangium sp. DT93]|uniref:hypothetical protein n=1 Tax=Streptosporangium sp. DT93 TaxID=3393428 RepID=UPI003CF2AE56